MAGSARQLRLADLNWTRLLPARFAFASLFDTEAAIATLPDIKHLEIVHGPGCRTAALLFLGWIATRMGWEAPGRGTESDAIQRRDGKSASFRLREAADAEGLHQCILEGSRVKFVFSRHPEKCLFGLHAECDGMSSPTRLLHARGNSITEVLLEELGRGGAHPLFYKSLDWVRAVL